MKEVIFDHQIMCPERVIHIMWSISWTESYLVDCNLVSLGRRVINKNIQRIPSQSCERRGEGMREGG